MAPSDIRAQPFHEQPGGPAAHRLRSDLHKGSATSCKRHQGPERQLVSSRLPRQGRSSDNPGTEAQVSRAGTPRRHGAQATPHQACKIPERNADGRFWKNPLFCAEKHQKLVTPGSRRRQGQRGAGLESRGGSDPAEAFPAEPGREGRGLVPRQGSVPKPSPGPLPRWGFPHRATGTSRRDIFRKATAPVGVPRTAAPVVWVWVMRAALPSLPRSTGQKRSALCPGVPEGSLPAPAALAQACGGDSS